MVQLLRKRLRLLPGGGRRVAYDQGQPTRLKLARQFEGKRAPDHIKANWPGSSWIVEVLADTTPRSGKRELRQHLHINSLVKGPQALGSPSFEWCISGGTVTLSGG